jgi:50S ribosomal subunit-associated GTPase HflX
VQLHVIDLSSPEALRQRATTRSVLRALGMSERDMQRRVLQVWNKADALPAVAAAAHAQADERTSGVVPACHRVCLAPTKTMACLRM